MMFRMRKLELPSFDNMQFHHGFDPFVDDEKLRPIKETRTTRRTSAADKHAWLNADCGFDHNCVIACGAGNCYNCPDHWGCTEVEHLDDDEAVSHFVNEMKSEGELKWLLHCDGKCHFKKFNVNSLVLLHRNWQCFSDTTMGLVFDSVQNFVFGPETPTLPLNTWCLAMEFCDTPATSTYLHHETRHYYSKEHEEAKERKKREAKEKHTIVCEAVEEKKKELVEASKSGGIESVSPLKFTCPFHEIGRWQCSVQNVE